MSPKKWALRAGAAAVAVLAVGGTVTYLNREWFIERAIRDQLASSAEYTFPAGPDAFQVLLCGTGSPELSTAMAQACTMVAVGGKVFVFDVGEGATRALSNSGVSLPDIDRVFITHYHSDHFNGLGTLINQSWTWGRTEPLDVMGPEGTGDVVTAVNSAYRLDNGFRMANMPELQTTSVAAQAHPMEIEFPAGARSTRVYDEDGVTIDAHLVVHDPVKTALGYVITYQGKKVFVSGDTEVSPLNLPAMQDADVVVHEAYATHLVRRAIPIMREMGLDQQAEVAERTIPYHADTIALARQAQEAGVRHLVLTHLTPYPANTVSRYLFTQGMGDHYDGELTVGEDGMVVTV